MSDIAQYLKECEEDLRKYLTPKHVKEAKQLLMRATTSAEVQSFLDRSCIKHADSRRYLLNLFNQLKQYRKGSKTETINRLTKTVDRWFERQRRGLLADCFLVVKKHRPLESPMWLKESAQEMPADVDKRIRITILLKLTEHARIPMKSVYILKKGGRSEQESDANVRGYRLCEFDTSMQPKQGFKFHTEGTKEGEVWLSNTFEAALNEEGTMILTGVQFRYFKMSLFKSPIFHDMELVEEILALSLMLPPHRLMELHNSLLRQRKELQSDAESFSNYNELRSLLLIVENPAKIRNFYYTIVWLHPESSLELNNESVNSHLFNFFSTYLPRLPFAMDKEHQSYNVALLKLIVKALYYGERRELNNQKLAQAINILLELDPQSFGFVIRLVEDQFVKNPAVVLSQKVSYRELEKRTFQEQQSVVKCITHYMLLLYNQHSRRLDISDYINILQQLQVTLKDRRLSQGHSQSMKYTKIMSTINDYIFQSTYFAVRNFNDFVDLWRGLAQLPAELQKVFVKPGLIESLKKYLHNEFSHRSFTAVKLLAIVFVQNRCSHIFDYSEFERNAFEEFFVTQSTSYRSNMFGVSQKISSKSAAYVPLNVLQNFVSEVYEPLMCNPSRNSATLSKQLHEAFGQHYFKDICGLLSNAVKQESLDSGKYYDSLRALVINIFLRELEGHKLSYSGLIRGHAWLFMVVQAKWLRDILLDNFLHGIKMLEKQKPGMVQSLLDSIYDADEAKLPQEIRDSLMLRLFDADKIERVTPEDIRATLFNNPSQAKIYCKLALTASVSGSVRSTLSISVNQVKDEIQAKKVGFRLIKQLYQYSEETWKHLQELFRYCDGTKLRVIVNNLHAECEEFLERVAKYEALFAKFRHIESLAAPRQACKDVLYNFKESNTISFRIPGVDLARLDKQLFECYQLRSFQSLLKFSSGCSFPEFVDTLNLAMDSLRIKVAGYFSQLKDKTLTLKDIEEMFRGLTVYDTVEVLKINKEATPEEITTIQLIYTNFTNVPVTSQLHKGLLSLCERYEDIQNIDILATLSNTYLQIKEGLLGEINALEFNNQFGAFANLLQRLSVRMDRKDEINRVISLLSSCAPMWQMMERIKKEDIDELKEYINEQEEGFVNSRNVIEIQCVHRFYHEILKKNTTLKGFVDTLMQFVEEESKKGGQSLAGSLESCEVNRATLEQKLSEVKHREASFKFNVLDLMKSCTITITHNGNTDEKELKVQQNDLRLSHERTFPQRQLAQFRDKSLLIINSLKRNRQEDFGFLDEEIRTLRLYVELYQRLEKILELYARLMSMGYPNNFINEVEQEGFEIVDSKFDNVVDYLTRLEDYERGWETEVKQVYQSSYGFCHYQGKELGRLINLLTQEKLDPSLNKILDAVTPETFKIFLETSGQEVAVKLKYAKDPHVQLEFVKEFFSYFDTPQLDNWKERKLLTNPPPVLVRLSICDDHRLYRALLASMGRSHNLSQLLFCKNATTKYEVETFLLRSLLDSQDRTYIVLEASKLPSRTQLHFQQLLESYLRDDNLAAKLRRNRLLFLDSNNNNQRIYTFLQNHKRFQLVREDQYTSTLQDRQFINEVQRVYIVHSQRAGYGKTFWIANHSKTERTQLQYFPLCGILDINKVVARLKGLLKGEAKGQSIVVQLHGVKNKQMLDEFLLQLLFFRAIYHEGFHFLPEDLTIYLQIQNISSEQQMKEYRSLHLFSDSPNVMVMKRPEPGLIQLDLTYRDHIFVLQYLHMISQATIDSNEVPYEGFSEKDITFPIDQVSLLFRQFFFDPLQAYEPSFVQFQSFLKLLLEAFKIFSKSYYYSVDMMKEYHDNFKDAGFDYFRSSYLKLLIDNARSFLIRTVDQSNLNELMTTGVFHERLRKFPFLILSNGDETTYSFVYLDHQEVPQIIKQYILIQENLLKGNNVNNKAYIDSTFSRLSLSFLHGEILAAQMFKMLAQIAGANQDDIIPSDDYSLTLDNFFKMCLMVQRIKSNVPVVIMGETGVGKTALITFLANNVYHDELMCVNVNAGTNQRVLTTKVEEIRRLSRQLVLEGKRLWVFFDEFNTTDDVGYISELIMERRFLGEPLDCDNVVFLAACNPFRSIRAKDKRVVLGYERRTEQIGNLLYRVLPPPESTLEVMWNFEELKEKETELYIRAILSRMNYYRLEDAVQVLMRTHSLIQKEVEKSAANLRDVFRFKTLFGWFAANMPYFPVEMARRTVSNLDFEFNYAMDRDERAFILTVCFCYYMRLSDFQLRNTYLEIVEDIMGFERGYINFVLENEQTDYLCRMNKPLGIATNLALRENVFACFVCLMNKLPVIIVGMPGCSKSLSVKLLLSNLRGSSSEEEYFRSLPEVEMFYFQGSESCTSEGVEQVFQRAHRIVKNQERDKKDGKSIVCILFDEIGLAEVSVHNPLKVLHAHLETRSNQLAFIGISNWELDAAKMSRFLVINRPLPNDEDLTDTASKIFESYDPIFPARFRGHVQALSITYWKFMKKWKESMSHPDFFGMRDFYALIKDICCDIKKKEVKFNDRSVLQSIIQNSVSKNFDGRPNSISLFMKILSELLPAFSSLHEEEDLPDPLDQIHSSLAETQSRCLLQIINDESVVFLVNHKLTQQNHQRYVITIHGSTFKEDEHSEEYNLYVISDVINYVSRGDLLIFKDVNNNIQTSLYDLFNKSFHRVGNRNFCRVSVGANYNPKCFVHPSFNCLVYVNEEKLADVDPPFLNRFEKHCLNIGGLLTEEEVSLIRELENWIDRLLYKVLGGDKLLRKENFIVNCSREALASLAIKCIMEGSNYQEQLQHAKEILIMNSTGDFELLVESDLFDRSEEEFVRRCIEKKYATQLEKSQMLIVTTYDQRVEISSDNMLSFGPRTKALRLCEMNCEKDLRNELEEFFHSPIFETLQVKLNLSSQGRHLCMLIFLLDKTMKKCSHSIEHKRIHIILATSRLEVVQAGIARQISYLNGYQQVFFDTLQIEQINLLSPPKDIDRLLKERPNLVDVKTKLSSIFYRAISRFEFTYETPAENEANRSCFWRMLQALPQNANFVKRSTQFMQRVLTQLRIDNWKEDVLAHRRLAMLAHSSFEAVEMYFLAQFEDTLNAFVRLIIDLDVIYQLNPEESLTILCYYSPESKGYLGPLLSKIEKSKKMLVDALADSILGDQSELAANKAPKELGSQKVILKQPRLFPTLVRAFPVLFSAAETQESVLNLCRKFKNQQLVNTDLTTTMSSMTIEEVQLKAMELLLNNPLFATEIGEAKLLTCLDTPEFLWAKEILMYELVNEYLQNVLKTSPKFLIEFLLVFNKFVAPTQTLLNRIIALILPEKLWRGIAYIFNDNIQDCNLLTEDSQLMTYLRTTKDSLVDKESNMTRIILEKCEQSLILDQLHIKQAGGYDKFLTHYDKFYSCVQLLSTSKLALSKMGSLQHELMLMWRDIDHEQSSQLFEKHLQEDCKEANFNSLNLLSRGLNGLLSQERIDAYRGKLLCYAYSLLPPDSLDERLLREIIEETNRSRAFSAHSEPIIRQALEYIEVRCTCSSVVDQLEEQYIQMQKPLKVINQALNNNLDGTTALIVAMHFSEALGKCLKETNENSQNLLVELLKSFEEGLEPLVQGRANALQSVFLAVYGKHTIESYAAYLEQINDEADTHPLPLEDMQRILNQQMGLLDNLRIYLMRLLVRRLSFAEFMRRYVAINRLPWITRYSRELAVKQDPASFQFEVEPNKVVREMLEKFMGSSYCDIPLFEQILSAAEKNPEDRLALLTFCRCSASSIANNEQTKRRIVELLQGVVASSSTMRLEAALMKRLVQSDLFPQTKIKHDQFTQEVIVNNFSWLLSIRAKPSPLSNIFFDTNWSFKNVVDSLSTKCLPGGPESFVIAENKKVLELAPRLQNIRTCKSRKCNYLFSDLEPQPQKRCPICGQDLEEAPILSTGILKPTRMPILDESYNQAYRHIVNRVEDECSRDPKLAQEQYGWPLNPNDRKEGRLLPLTKVVTEIAVESALLMFIKLGWISAENCMLLWKCSPAEADHCLYTNISSNVERLQHYSSAPEARNRYIRQFYLTHSAFVSVFEQQARVEKEKIDQTITQLAVLAKTASQKDVLNINCLIRQNEKALKELNTKTTGPLNSYYLRNKFEDIVQDALYNLKQEAEDLSQCEENSLEKAIRSDSYSDKKLSFMRILQTGHQININQSILKGQLMIQQKYPVLYMVLSDRSRLERLQILYGIIKFVRELQESVTNRLSRTMAKKLKLSDYLRQQVTFDLSRKQRIESDAEKCIENWNKLRGNETEQKHLSSCLSDFLLEPDNIELKNLYTTFTKIQNFILARVDSVTPDKKLSVKVRYIPAQTAVQDDLAYLSRQEAERLVSDFTTNSTDWKTVETAVVNRLRNKPQFTEDLIFIEYSDQVKIEPTRYYTYLNSLRGGPSEPKQEIFKLREKLVREQDAHPPEFYYMARMMQQTLERILVNLQSIPSERSTTLLQYNRKNVVKGTSDEALEYLKDVRVEDAFNAYETIESLVFDKIWEMLDEKYKVSLNQTLKEQLSAAIKEHISTDPTSQLLELQTLSTALNRLAARCLSLGEVSEVTSLEDLMKNRPDVWPYSFPPERIDRLAKRLVGVQLMHCYSLRALIAELQRPAAVSNVPLNPEVTSRSKIDIDPEFKKSRKLKRAKQILRD